MAAVRKIVCNGAGRPGAAGDAPAEQAASPCIWAVGGGKGGVGKSVITSNLAVALARRGQRCVVMDADLGAANLHTVLGVKSPARTLSHFLNKEVEELRDLMTPTPEPNLWLISGSRALVGMANPKHSQKEKLLRHIRRLEVDHVLLDLSAGSSFNVLDFFLEAQHAILVIIPEPTSIENAYHFLKAAFFRSMSRATRRSPVRAAITSVLEDRVTGRIRSPRELIEAVKALDPQAGEALGRQAGAFRPRILLNQSRTPQHRQLGREIRDACATYLGVDVEFLGTLERDESVRVAVGQRRAVIDLFPSCPFSMDLEAVAVRVASEGSRSPRLLAGVEPQSAAERDRVLEAVAAPPMALTARDLARPGDALKRRRVQLALELPEIYQRTRIRNLEHIEGERFDRLPPEPYVRGYVLQYARALGIRDAEKLTASFLERYRRSAAIV